MENKKDKINWLQIIISAIIPSLLLTILSYLLSVFTVSNLSFSISESTYFEDNYYTIISFESASSKVYRDVEIYITDNILIHIQSATDINHDGNNIIINEIAPKSNNSFIIISETPIVNDTFFVNEEYSANIYFPFSEPTLFDILISYAVVLFIMMFIALIFSDKMYAKNIRKHDFEWNKKIELINQKNNEVLTKISAQKEENDIISKQNQELYDNYVQQTQKSEDEIKNMKKLTKQMRVFYQIRISDLDKELSFWRNTIRKLLYSKENEFKKADFVIETVTKELKTYTTVEKSKVDIDKEFFIARMINDKMNDE